jgi:hypothetical protein
VVVVVVVVVEEDEEEEEEGKEKEEGEDEDEDDGDGAEVPFVAKRAVRVCSAWGMKVLLPVRSARRYTVAARSALLDASSKLLPLLLLLLNPSA